MDNGCRGGHGGINGGGSNYYPFGVMEKPGAEILPRGRQGPFRGPKTADDAYVVRAPSLRNVALTAPHSHSGKVWSLSQAVAIMGTRQLGEKLDDGEIAAIPAFLHTLTGEPPRVDYPILPVSTGTTSRPEPMTE